MKTELNLKVSGMFIITIMFMITMMIMFTVVTGCNFPDEAISEDEENHEVAAEDETAAEDEADDRDEGHYWPWLGHGNLILSTGEEIPEASFFVSDNDDIGKEFTSGDMVEVKKIWPVIEDDVFEAEWVKLVFDVTNNYVDMSADNYKLDFEIVIDIVANDEPAEGNLREYEVDIVEVIDDFAVRISKVILAREQQNHDDELYDYVALVVSMENLK